LFSQDFRNVLKKSEIKRTSGKSRGSNVAIFCRPIAKLLGLACFVNILQSVSVMRKEWATCRISLLYILEVTCYTENQNIYGKKFAKQLPNIL